jgi:hypothetical protein
MTDSENRCAPIGMTITESLPHRTLSLTFVVTMFVSIGIVTLSLALFFIFGGYAVTVASFVIACYCLYTINYMRVNHIIVYGLLIGFLLINAAIHLFRLDGIEFLKSFMLTAVTLFVYISSLVPIDALRKRIDYASVLKIATYAIVFFLFVQVSEQFILGTTTSWFWLDGISISTADEIGRFEAANALGIFRPISFFHEPSYLAAVAFILLVVNDHLFSRKKIRYVLIGSIVLSFSASMLGILLTYLTFNLWFRNRAQFMAWRWQVTASLMILLLVIIYPEHLFKLMRLGEIFMDGTSGYIRVIEPWLEVKKVLSELPFGIALGQSEVVFNNSLFLIPLYFGFLSPFLILIWFFVIFQKLTRIRYVVNYFLGISSLLLVSGAIFTMESALLLLILNYAFMPVRKS